MSVSKNIESKSDCSKNVEGYLPNRLHSALDITIEKFLSSIRFSNFKKKYKAIFDINPDALKSIHNQWILQLHKSIHEDLDEICTEYKIDFLLTSLEKINHQQCSSQTSWRPSENPEEDLRDHIYPLKVKQKELLETLLNKVEVTNEELVNVAAINHAEIMHIKKENEDLHGKFSNIVTCLNGPDLQKLQTNMENYFEEL